MKFHIFLSLISVLSICWFSWFSFVFGYESSMDSRARLDAAYKTHTSAQNTLIEALVAENDALERKAEARQREVEALESLSGTLRETVASYKNWTDSQ